MARPSITIIALLAIAFMVAALSMLVFPIQPSLSPSGGINKTPTVSFTIYGGEISSAKYGFGFSPTNLTSPGPTISFSSSDVVNITFINAGTMSHAFVVTDAPKSTGNILFGAEIGSSTNPLSPGGKGTIIFQPSGAGNRYYICPVPGHAELGMWGNINITQGTTGMPGM